MQYRNFILVIKEFSWVEQKKIWSCYKFEEISICNMYLIYNAIVVSQDEKRRKFKNSN